MMYVQRLLKMVLPYCEIQPEARRYKELLIKSLESKPDLIIDDGGDFATITAFRAPRSGCEYSRRRRRNNNRYSSLESDGERRQVKFPMVAVNDAYCKYLFDNRYGRVNPYWDGLFVQLTWLLLVKSCCSRLWLVW